MMAATLPPKAPAKEPLNTMQLLGLVSEMGFLIALPAAALGFGGAWLDKEIGTSPLFLVGGLIFALASSVLAIWHRIKPFLQ